MSYNPFVHSKNISDQSQEYIAPLYTLDGSIVLNKHAQFLSQPKGEVLKLSPISNS